MLAEMEKILFMVPSSSRSRTRGFQPLNREFEPPWDHHYERKAQLDNIVATCIIKIIRIRRYTNQ